MKPKSKTKEEFKALEKAHLEFAHDLSSHISHSLSSYAFLLNGGTDFLDPGGTLSRSLAIDRGFAEGQSDEFEYCDPAERELAVLLRTLSRLVDRHVRAAEQFDRFAKDVRRGRPGKESQLPLVNSLSLTRSAPKISKAKRGRRLEVDITNDALLALVEDKPMNTTERAMLQDFVKSGLASEGKHTTGARPERLTRNLQRRLSQLRRVRKLSGESDE